jgi:hypothetical protein
MYMMETHEEKRKPIIGMKVNWDQAADAFSLTYLANKFGAGPFLVEAVEERPNQVFVVQLSKDGVLLRNNWSGDEKSRPTDLVEKVFLFNWGYLTPIPNEIEKAA